MEQDLEVLGAINICYLFVFLVYIFEPNMYIYIYICVCVCVCVCVYYLFVFLVYIFEPNMYIYIYMCVCVCLCVRMSNFLSALFVKWFPLNDSLWQEVFFSHNLDDQSKRSDFFCFCF